MKFLRSLRAGLLAFSVTVSVSSGMELRDPTGSTAELGVETSGTYGRQGYRERLVLRTRGSTRTIAETARSLDTISVLESLSGYTRAGGHVVLAIVYVVTSDGLDDGELSIMLYQGSQHWHFRRRIEWHDFQPKGAEMHSPPAPDAIRQLALDLAQKADHLAYKLM